MMEGSNRSVADLAMAAMMAGQSDEELESLDLPGFRLLKESLEHRPPAPPVMVIPRLAWEGRITLFAAREKAGKSTLLGAAAAAVTRGGEFLNGECLQGRVVWVGPEEHESDLQARFKQWDADPAKLVYSTYEMTDPLKQTRTVVDLVRPRLLVIDTLWSFVGDMVNDHNSAEQWLPIMEWAARMAREFGVAIVFLHHSTKAKEAKESTYRGSSAIGAGVDVICEMYEDNRQPTHRHVRTKGRVAQLQRLWTYRLVGVPPYLTFDIVDKSEAQRPPTTAEDAIRRRFA